METLVTIVVEDSVYQVSEAEWKKLTEMQKNDNPDHENTMLYLDNNVRKYKYIGRIYFDCRR